jgi:hypothetical protein
MVINENIKAVRICRFFKNRMKKAIENIPPSIKNCQKYCGKSNTETVRKIAINDKSTRCLFV